MGPYIQSCFPFLGYIGGVRERDFLSIYLGHGFRGPWIQFQLKFQSRVKPFKWKQTSEWGSPCKRVLFHPGQFLLLVVIWGVRLHLLASIGNCLPSIESSLPPSWLPLLLTSIEASSSEKVNKQ